MRLFVCFFFFLCAARGDWQCVPDSYLLSTIPIQLSDNGSLITPALTAAMSTHYCTDVEFGGGLTYNHFLKELDCDPEWSFWGDACLSDEGAPIDKRKRCSCSWDHCGSGWNNYCVCHMQGHYDIMHCYKTAALCGSCDAGSFRLGCGCVPCNNSATYDPSIYNFQTIACGGGAQFACGSGTCSPCPIGYECVGGNTMPTPCTAGYYQTEKGKSSCNRCECPPNHHVPTNSPKRETDCDGARGMDGLCQKCDACTDRSLIKATSDFFQRCPPQDWSYGRQTGKTDQDGPQTCVPCLSCADGTYSTVQTADKYCLIDQTDKQCRDIYYSVKDVNSTSLQDTTLAANVLDGPMPFVPGWTRKEGRQHKPGPDDAASSLRGSKALLPYYTQCTDLTIPHALYFHATQCASTLMQCAPPSLVAAMLPRSTWAYDCLPQLLAVCPVNHYAVLGPWTPVAGLAYVESCEPCPHGSTSAGGRVTQCICDDTYAMASDIQLQLGSQALLAFPAIPNLQKQCVHCNTQVYIQNHLGHMQQEAIACPRDGTIQRCTKRQYLADGKCTSCSLPEQIPNDNRLQCTVCPNGTYTQPYQSEQYFACLACNPYLGQYQDKPGQNQCATKRSKCPTDQMLVPNYDATLDHGCQPCQANCGDTDAIQIRFANKTGSCDDHGHSYFGCFSLAPGLRAHFPSNVRYSYVLTDPAETDLSKAHISIEECTGEPPYARWLSYEEAPTTKGGGKQCFFACKYGVNPQQATAYKSSVLYYLQTQRVDLLPFWDSVARSRPSRDTLAYRVNYQYVDNTAPALDWAVSLNLQVQPTCEVCDDAFWLNTFLLVGGGPSPTDAICRAPAEAKSQGAPCAPGFVFDDKDLTRECALLARTQLYRTQSYSVEGGGELIPPSYYVTQAEAPVCRTDVSDLSSFQPLCNTNCLEQRHAQALALLPLQAFGSKWMLRVFALQQYLSGKDYWYSQHRQNPYDNLQSNQCHFTKCAPGTFRYDLLQHTDSSFRNMQPPLNLTHLYACVPCDRHDEKHGTILCDQVYDSIDPRFYDNATCWSESTHEHTASHVCNPCAQTKPGGAQLIRPDDTLPDDTSITLYQHWWTIRTQPAYNDYFTTQHPFDRVLCRYTCPVGSRSNDQSVDAYNEQPCVPCTDVSSWEYSCPANATVYYNPTTIAHSSSACGATANNYIPYKPQCASCTECTGPLCAAQDDPMQYVYSPTLRPSLTYFQCMTRCDPSRYHTLLKTGAYADGSFAPRDSIDRCEPCSENPTLACGGSCQVHQYMLLSNDSSKTTSCLPCDTTPCTNLSMFRESCSGATSHDAQCLPCSRAWLFNAPLLHTAYNRFLANDLQNQVNVTTRRWVASSPGLLVPGTTSCRVACVNNYMWVDAYTGQPPAATANLTESLMCIPCSATYLAHSVLQESDRPLYSVWNSSNTTLDTIPMLRPGLAFLWGHAGACYYCPPGHDTLAYGSDVMCESMPGYSTYAQGTAPGTIVVVTIGNASMQSNESTPAFFMLDGFRRRLLQHDTVSSPYSVKLIRARTAPILSPRASSFLLCCLTYQNLTENVKCRQYRRQNMEYKKNLVGTALDYDFCAHTLGSTPTGRRLLQQLESPPHNMCFAGNYKPERGNSPCFSCPHGASTASDTATSASACICLPGYTAHRDANTRQLLHCTPCGVGYYRSPLQPDDAPCLPCPPHQKTPTSTSGFCYCLAGHYKLGFGENETCTPCDKGFYCDADNMLTACPRFSTTVTVGASTRGECKCLQPLYYGDLARPDSECIYVRPGRNYSSQQCALGWIYDASTDRCVSSCPPGQYAELGAMQAITGCVSCPVDTYDAGTRALVHIPLLPRHEQCTQCPPNMHTAGVGTIGAAGCVCSFQQNGSVCQLCAANFYYASGTCHPCPALMSSSAGAIGLAACMCAQGSRAVRQADLTLHCEACPLGYYSNTMGQSCTRCPHGFTTLHVGCTTRLQCVVTAA